MIQLGMKHELDCKNAISAIKELIENLTLLLIKFPLSYLTDNHAVNRLPVAHVNPEAYNGGKYRSR